MNDNGSFLSVSNGWKPVFPLSETKTIGTRKGIMVLKMESTIFSICTYKRHTTFREEKDMAIESKTSRIDIRVVPVDKRMLEQAASIKRVSVSQYILSVALEAAKMDIRSEEAIALSDESRDAVLRLLDNPPEPNAALKSLFKQ